MQAKTLNIPSLEGLDSMRAAEIASAMETGASRQYIENVNWPAGFPYAPIAVFDATRSGDTLYLRFFVRGEGVKAVYGEDDDPVYEDSCVEFFIMAPGADGYYNFEFNAIGTCKAAYGPDRHDRTPLAEDVMSRIIRMPSMGKEPFDEKPGIASWELIVGIPIALFAGDYNGREFRANFYKCGDGTSIPHFLSWAPIDTPQPDFHRPEFFGKITL